jgi:hypothetical protein
MESFLKFCRESNIYERPGDVKLPSARGPPVQLIADPTEGFACAGFAKCTHACKDLASMHRHGLETHNTTSVDDIQYRSCQVQQIFTGFLDSCFEVGEDVSEGVSPDVTATIQATFLPAIDHALVTRADAERESTPLMRIMGWDKFKVELRMNPSQRLAAFNIKKNHTDEELSGVLTRLAATVRDHMTTASTILDGHPHRLSLSKHLLYGSSIPRDM